MANDSRAQSEIYDAYRSSMLEVIRSRISRVDHVSDVLNMSFTVAFRKMHTFGFNGSFEGWLKTIARRTLYNYMVEENRKHRVTNDYRFRMDYSDTCNGLDNLYCRDLFSIIESLPNKTREVFKMFSFGGYTHENISNEVGIATGTSKWHVHEAKRYIKEEMRKRDMLN